MRGCHGNRGVGEDATHASRTELASYYEAATTGHLIISGQWYFCFLRQSPVPVPEELVCNEGSVK